MSRKRGNDCEPFTQEEPIHTQSPPEHLAFPISLHGIFLNYDQIIYQTHGSETLALPSVAISQHMKRFDAFDGMNGFARMQACRRALAALDRRGWDRSYHQKLFHDNFIRACSRIFFKNDGEGAFERAHQKILEINGWDSLPQEILISTPRRFGKTISVSMFAAAMIFSCPKFELSIYSTCKRISQKLLRNITKFLGIIHTELEIAPCKVLRLNAEEVHIQGNEGSLDIRVVNSYPSKVLTPSPRNLACPKSVSFIRAVRPVTLSWCSLSS